MWRSIESKLRLAVNAAAYDALVEDFSGKHLVHMLTMLTNLNTSADVDVAGPVFELASLLPPAAATGVSEVGGLGCRWGVGLLDVVMVVCVWMVLLPTRPFSSLYLRPHPHRLIHNHNPRTLRI